MPETTVKIFLSHDAQDAELCDLIEDHLKFLERDDVATLWHARRILAGEPRESTIDRELATADIILLLISAHFYNSDRCYEIERQSALESRSRGTKVIPIILSHYNWRPSDFDDLEPLPRGGEPITAQPNRESILVDIAREIAQTACDLKSQKERNAIAQELLTLRINPDYAALHACIEKVEQLFTASKYPTEIYQCFLSVFKQMNDQIQKEESTIEELLFQASTGEYFQAGSSDSTLIDGLSQSTMQVLKEVFQICIEDYDPLSCPMRVPVILLAMNKAEVEALASLSVFEGYPDKLLENFKALRTLLNSELPDWQNHYQDDPKHWQPFGHTPDNNSIEILLRTALETAKDQRSQRYGLKYGQNISLTPDYLDIRKLNDATARYRLQKLRSEECVIIIDAISMYHPVIFRAFQQSLLDAYHNTFIVISAPTPRLLSSVRELTVALEFQLEEMELFKRRRHSREEAHAPSSEFYEEGSLTDWLSHWIGKSLRQPVGSYSPPVSPLKKNINRFDD